MKTMSFASAADGHLSIKQVNHSAVLSSVNGHSSITLFVTSDMSFITSGMHNFRAVNNLIPSNEFALGGPLCHDAICVAFFRLKWSC